MIGDKKRAGEERGGTNALNFTSELFAPGNKNIKEELRTVEEKKDTTIMGIQEKRTNIKDRHELM